MFNKTSLFSAFKNAFTYKILSFFFYFLSSIFVFRYFDPSIRGQIAILIAPILIGQLAFLDGGTKVQDFISKNLRNDTDKDFSSLWTSYLIKLVSAIFISFLIFSVVPTIVGFYSIEDTEEIFAIASLLIILNFAVGPVDLNVLQGLKEYRHLRYYGILESIGPLLAILITISFNFNFQYYLYLYIASRLILLPYAWFLLIRLDLVRYFKNINLSEFKEIISFSLPLWFASFLTYGSTQSIPLIAGAFFNFEILGNISLALGVATIVISFIEFADGFALPKANENLKSSIKGKKSNNIYILKFSSFLSFFSIFFSFFIFLSSDLIVLIIGGEKYSVASEILKWLSIVIGLRALGVLRILFYLEGKTLLISYFSAIKIFFELILFFLFFFWLGYIGLALSLYIGFFIWSILIINFIKKENPSLSIIYNKLLINHLKISLILVFLCLLYYQFPISSLILCVSLIIISLKRLNNNLFKFNKFLNT